MLRLWDRFLAALAMGAAGILLLIATAITVNVILRSTGFPVLYGTLDAVEYGLLLACFLGTPWVLAQRAHVQVDLLVNALPDPVEYRLSRIVSALGAGLCLAFAYFGFQAMSASYARGAMIRTSFVIPEWWTLAIIPTALTLCALEFVRQCWWPVSTPKEISGV
ncbi:TRAP transporter small permease [Halovulum sp. GXIMD14793]